MKARRQKTAQRSSAQRGPRHSSAADLQTQLDQRTRELAEALEQQTATSQVLHVISSSAGELEFGISDNTHHALRLCEVNSGSFIDTRIRLGG
jgi:hypothetical protein